MSKRKGSSTNRQSKRHKSNSYDDGKTDLQREMELYQQQEQEAQEEIYRAQQALQRQQQQLHNNNHTNKISYNNTCYDGTPISDDDMDDIDDTNDNQYGNNMVEDSPVCTPESPVYTPELMDPSTYDETVKEFSEEYKCNDRLIVNTYIKQTESNTFLNNEVLLFNQIPYLINHLTLKYYHISAGSIVNGIQQILISKYQTKISNATLETELLPQYFCTHFRPSKKYPNIYRQIVQKERIEWERKNYFIFVNALVKYGKEIVVIKHVNNEKKICSVAKRWTPAVMFAKHVPLSHIEYWIPGDGHWDNAKVRVIAGKLVHESASLIGIDQDEAVIQLDKEEDVITIISKQSVVMYIE